MKKLLLMKTMLLLCALVAGSSSVWAGDVVGTINFNGSATKINDASVTGNDSQGNEWTITTVGTTSYTSSSTYYQVGSSSKPATSITFTTTLPSSQTIKAFSAKFGGFSSTAGDVTLKVGSTTVGSGSLNGTSDVTVSATNTTTSSTVLTVTVTNIAKGVKCYFISYTYADNTPSSNATFTEKTPSIDYPEAKTYSQAPTTAAGYSGTITYSMTANTAGATINASTGVVTVTGGGSVTVKATAAAASGFTGSEDTYTLTVNDTRTSAGLSWSAASADVTYGADNNVFPTLTNTHSVPVTYSSTNTKAATINASTGEITLLDFTGDTQIKAIFAGNDDYLPQTVSYTLSVTKAPFSVKDGVFDFVEAAGAGEDYGSGITLEDDGQTYVYDNSTWTAGNITMVASGKYRWWYNGKELRFYNNNPQSKITLSVPSGYVITKVVFNGGSDFSVSSGELSSTTSGTWTGAANSVVFTYDATSSQNVKSITVTYGDEVTAPVQSYGWASFVAYVPLEFATNTAYVVTDASVANGLTLAPVTQVPAGTPLLLKGAGEKTAVVLTTTPAAPATNLLEVSDGSDLASGYYPYVLAKNGESACFKQWTGAMSSLDGRVVLVLDEAVATSRSFFNLDDETTSIKQVETSKSNIDGFYNLAGQRVAQPIKGLYIVNGKKFIMK